MDFLQIILAPFSLMLRFFCQVFQSYGVALILFTLVIKVILFPLSLKGKKSMITSTMLSGQMKELQQRYGNNREKYSQEVQKLYQENGASMSGGCVWSLIPVAILFPLYSIIRRPLRYMMMLTDGASTAVANALGWTAATGTEFTVAGTNELILASMMNGGNLQTAATAAGATTTGLFGLFVINFSFLGMDLSQIPNFRIWDMDLSWNSIGLFLLPIFSALLSLFSMIVSQKTNQMNQNQENPVASNKGMMLMGPVLSLWIGYTLPAGLCIYWITNSILMMIQEVICAKMLKKDYEAARQKMEEQARKSKEKEKERRRQAAQRKAEAIASGSKKKVQAKKGPDVSASREGMRTYARGRAYDPNRYPITPYHDPNGPVLEIDQEEILEGTEPLSQNNKIQEASLMEEDILSTENPVPKEREGDYEEPYSTQGEED